MDGSCESGEGYCDILVEIPEDTKKQYAAKLENDGMQSIVKFGIACYKKRCKVVVH